MSSSIKSSEKQLHVVKVGSEFKRSHIPALDGVRGMAALMVMWFHFFQKPEHVPEGIAGAYILKFNSLGQSGVDLFFVLSGFLITRILISRKHEPGYFRNFYARRSLRIFPLYYFFLVVSLFVVPATYGKEFPEFSQHWWWWLYLQNLPPTFGIAATGPGHYWSLAVEEHFYLVWPLIVFLLPRRKFELACIILVVLSVIFRVVFVHYEIGVFYFTLTRLDSLSLGALLAVSEARFVQSRVYWNKIFGIGMISLLAVLLPVYALVSGLGGDSLQILKPLALAVTYFALIGFVITAVKTSIFPRFFASKPMCSLGQISYGLYVYHWLCFFVISSVLSIENVLILLPISFAFAILVSTVSFYLLESPFLRLKRFFE